MTTQGNIGERLIGTVVIAASSVRRSFDFAGRSRRTEFLCYWVVAMAVELLFLTTTQVAIPTVSTTTTLAVLNAILSLPLFALIARRFHDMGLTGWLALPTLLTVALNVHEDYWHYISPIDVKVEGYPYDGTAFAVLALPGVIILFWALIQGGQAGSNRYGPDPRHETVEKAVA